jgi:hypothetical protein
MQLEDYFIFLATNDIRLKNTRVGIETVLYDYIYRSRTPENSSINLSLTKLRAGLCYCSLLSPQQTSDR